MTTRKRYILIGLGSFFGIAAIALAIFIARFDQDKAKKYIITGVSKATGRQLRINGDLQLNVGWISRVSASQIEFENAGWSKHPQMAEIGSLEFQVDLWQLLTKFRLVLPTVTISQPKIILEKNAAGAANWEFRAAPTGPQKRAEFPVIEKLVVRDGTLSFENQQTKTQIDLKVSEAEGAGFLQQPVKLRVEGTYQKLPLTITMDGGSYENLRSSKMPYPLRINLSAGKLKAIIDGNLIEPLEMKGEDLSLEVQGDDMAQLYPLIRLVFPKTPPYHLKGRLKREGDVWNFANISGRVGGTDLAGIAGFESPSTERSRPGKGRGLRRAARQRPKAGSAKNHSQRRANSRQIDNCRAITSWLVDTAKIVPLLCVADFFHDRLSYLLSRAA